MNIVITGASTGVGNALALRFAAEPGYKVFALSRNQEKLEQLAAGAVYGNIVPVVTDLATYEFGHFIKILHDHGISSIGALINNAGLLLNKPFSDITGAEWEQVYKVNVFGTAQLTRALLPYMGGVTPTHIVNISSIGGVGGTLKFAGLSAYSSSKGALCILTQCLAEELKGNNISVNCLALGSVQTEMLTKAFPGYAANMSPELLSEFIFDFSRTGWQYFNGKILEVSTTNP